MLEVGSLQHARKRPSRNHEPDREDERRTRGRERTNHPPVERQSAERPASEDRNEADSGDRRGEADAERDDEREPEPDPVQRDRRQEDDERRRARKQPGGDSNAEDSLRRQGVVVFVMPVVVVVGVTVAMRVPVVVVVAWWWLRERSRWRSTDAPTNTTSSPETSVSHG